MTKTRPVSVLVVAILQLVFGSFGLIMGLCAGVVLLAGGSQMFGVRPPAGQKILQVELERFMQERAPSHQPVQLAAVAAEVTLSALMVAGGVGLLGMRI